MSSAELHDVKGVPPADSAAQLGSPIGVLPVSILLLCSGFCALVYQVAWLRLLRLVFGASTASQAAVIAIFMAGLGFGSLLLGKRADAHPNPLRMYARLELGIALSAAASPLLVLAVRAIYLGLGGTAVLGDGGGNLLRLLLSTLVLGLPTFLMGGTLPAVARAAAELSEKHGDKSRRYLGILYGGNTLGAVLGALCTTLWSLEVLGIQKSIWAAAALNGLVFVFAERIAAQRGDRPVSQVTEPERPKKKGNSAIAGLRKLPFILPAAAIVGATFLLMELVWYRMLAPLLGGSSYTFGLILAVALLGLGLGSLLYGSGNTRRRPGLAAFATTCSLEAVLLLIPFALGDSLALLAAVLQQLRDLGFVGLIVTWLSVICLVVLPAALVSGYQFPLLIAILGDDERRVGREVGLCYSWNTAGAIFGSVVGGFGIIPLLSATGAWRACALALLLLGALAVALALRNTEQHGKPIIATLLTVAGLSMLVAPGPSAFWRHSPIGLGMLSLDFADHNGFKDSIHAHNRTLRWETDGRESSVALDDTNGWTFIVNGKSDGSAREDAATMVMSGLLPAALHPAPRKVLLIGHGTGTTAGWLAQVPGIERVDVVEIEAAILEVAEACRAVNFDVPDNPKVNVIIGDGREHLLSSKERYDIIFSEPSNPYRAGIASLFSQDFYDGVQDRLEDGGIFVQWFQGYHVDAELVRTAYATISSVFPVVETWTVHYFDMAFTASKQAIEHDAGRLRARLAQQPFFDALRYTWGVSGVEGLYSAYLANGDFARSVAEIEGHWVNTDDRPIIEFGFARNAGRTGLFSIPALHQLATARGQQRPPGLSDVDWAAVHDLRGARELAMGGMPPAPTGMPDGPANRARARRAYAQEDLVAACDHWFSQSQAPASDIDLLLVVECLAEQAQPETADLLPGLHQRRPVEAAAISARMFARAGQPVQAAAELERAFVAFRKDPWVHTTVMARALDLAVELCRKNPALSAGLFEALQYPFAARILEESRKDVRLEVAMASRSSAQCAEAFTAFEPWPPWRERFLRDRCSCYTASEHPLKESSCADLEQFRRAAPTRLEAGLVP
ncbi:MAG: spermidine synthase [Rickettsiales bacterium]|nr:spermidine synthase [Rickettsiales bacterium]|tara:strand:+ start:2244 stop:5474 length:3231 start_codon:yes stop_codon:yes gene_type:complete